MYWSLQYPLALHLALVVLHDEHSAERRGERQTRNLTSEDDIKINSAMTEGWYTESAHS